MTSAHLYRDRVGSLRDIESLPDYIFKSPQDRDMSKDESGGETRRGEVSAKAIIVSTDCFVEVLVCTISISFIAYLVG